MDTSDALSNISEAVGAALAPYLDENAELRESLADVRMMMSAEDKGWSVIGGLVSGDRTHGLDLEEVKMISEKARVKVAAAALERRAADLHAGFVWGNGVEIDNVVRDPNAQGRPPSVVRFYEDPINQENLFSDGARKELQKSRFTDGNVIVFCDTRTKKVRRIPIYEIQGFITHPDYPDEITAWLRSWTHYTPNGEEQTRKAWVYTTRHEGAKRKSITVNNESVPVLQDTIAVDLRANRQTGWALGLPDALAGMHWAEAYGQVLRYGQIVNESLAKVVYKVVAKSAKGAQNVGVKMRGSQVAGTAVVGEGQDISLVNSSQRSFDFTAARPLAAMAAAAWNVTNPDLLNDSSASGSSYGSLNALTEGNRNAMRGLQAEWTQFLEDIFVVMGFDRPGIHWAPLEKPDSYRLAQELTLYAPALSDEEYRAAVLDRLDIPGDPKAIPPSLKQRVVDTSTSAGVQQASPDQGQNSDAGSSDSGSRNDQRTDTIGEVMAAMQRDDFLKEMRELVERFEAASGKA